MEKGIEAFERRQRRSTRKGDDWNNHNVNDIRNKKGYEVGRSTTRTTKREKKNVLLDTWTLERRYGWIRVYARTDILCTCICIRTIHTIIVWVLDGRLRACMPRHKTLCTPPGLGLSAGGVAAGSSRTNPTITSGVAALLRCPRPLSSSRDSHALGLLPISGLFKRIIRQLTSILAYHKNQRFFCLPNNGIPPTSAK